MIERLSFGTAQVTPGTTRVALRPGEGLTVGLGVSASTPSELDGATAFVWTNYGSDDPRVFQPFATVDTPPRDGHQRAFETTLPPATLGTFIVTVYVVVDGVQHWASEFGAANMVFRVMSPDIDRLYVRQVPIDKANARSDSTDISTIDDMLDDQPGRYSLAGLAAEGVNCLWVQAPYRIDLWDGLDPIDDAGSDFASTDWFAIDPELSVEARSVPAWDLDRQRLLANGTMRRFVEEAHSLGMKIIFDIAPNHVGHNFIFRDDFGGDPGPEVRRRDYGQAAISPEQLAQVQTRLASSTTDETIKNYMEWMLPQMYAAHYPDGTYNPYGANSVYETYSPDWYGRWADTKHLNHGGHAGQHIWEPRTEQNWHVLAYLKRAMAWAVHEFGVDGFRVDHALGMPFPFFDQIMPEVEMETRRRTDKDSLIWVLEDHDRKDYSARVCDVVQSKGYEQMLDALLQQNAERIWELYGDPNFGIEFVATGNHDEVRGSRWFAGDLLAYGNAVISMQLMGGPMTMLAGDEFAESQQLRFKARGGIPTLWQYRMGSLPADSTNLAYWIGRGGGLKTTHPALRGRQRERLHSRTGDNRSVLAAARSVDDPAVVPLLVFNNLSRTDWGTGTYDLGRAVTLWLNESIDSFYQARDLMGFDPERPLWRRALSGREILAAGLSIGLQPYQVQALELDRVG